MSDFQFVHMLPPFEFKTGDCFKVIFKFIPNASLSILKLKFPKNSTF